MNIHVAQTVRESEAKRIAESLIPELQKRAALAEELRRVPDESIALLKSSGLLRTIQPASCGGDQLSMRAHVDVVSSVARGCNATGWVLGVYQAHSWMFGHMSGQGHPQGRWQLYFKRVLALRLWQCRCGMVAAGQ